MATLAEAETQPADLAEAEAANAAKEAVGSNAMPPPKEVPKKRRADPAEADAFAEKVKKAPVKGKDGREEPAKEKKEKKRKNKDDATASSTKLTKYFNT